MGTALAIAHAEYPGGPSSHTVLITSAGNANLIDSVTAAPLAAALQAPILLSQNSERLGQETSTYLASHNITQIYLIGADANAALEDQLPANVSAVPVSGPDRFATAAAISSTLAHVTGDASFSTLYVASAANNGLTDALAVAPWAAAAGAPILLAAPNQSALPASEAAFVAGQASQTALAVGAATGFRLTLTGDAVKTVGSKDASPFANAVAVAEAFGPPSGFPIVDLAHGGDNGAHLVDAITGAPLAASQHAPILFTDGNQLPPSVQAFLAGQWTRDTATIDVFGGSASISDQTTTQVVQNLTGSPASQTTQVRVSANVPWVATGISLQPGEAVSLQATGTINDGSVYPQNANSGPQGLGDGQQRRVQLYLQRAQSPTDALPGGRGSV